MDQPAMGDPFAEPNGLLPYAEDEWLAEPPAEEAAAPDPNASIPEDEAAIDRMEASMARPSSLKAVLEGMDANRRYVHTEANQPLVTGGVSSNYLFRYQQLHMAQLFARDPQIRAHTRKRMGQFAAQDQQRLEDFGKSIELIVEAFASDANLRAIVTGAIQEVDTTACVIIKRRWCEDLTRDPVGTTRQSDLQVLVAEVRRLLGVRAKQGAAFDDGPDALRLRQLSEDIQTTLSAEAWRATAFPDTTVELVTDPTTGQTVQQEAPLQYPAEADPRKFAWVGDLPTPEELDALPQSRRFEFDIVYPEDFGVDPAIIQPEKFYNAGFMWNVAWMTEAEIRRTFGLPEEFDLGTGRGHRSPGDWLDGRSAMDSDEADLGTRNGIDDQMKGDRYAVVEYHDAITRRVYNWIRGSRKMLRNELAKATSKRYFPYYMLQFNRVSGRLIGTSNVDLGRSLQEEINLARTWKRQAKRGAYNRYLMENGLLDANEAAKLEDCPPEGIVFTQKSVEDIEKKMTTIKGSYQPEVHDVEDERVELGTLMNAPQAAIGMTSGSSDTATEASIANQNMDVLTEYHRWILESQLLTPIVQDMAEVLLQALPEENAKAIGGPGIVWPALNREQLWQNLTIEIEGGSTAMPNVGQLKNDLQWLLGIVTGAGGQPDVVAFTRKAAQIIGWKEDPTALIAGVQPLQVVGQQQITSQPKNPTAGGVVRTGVQPNQQREPGTPYNTPALNAADPQIPSPMGG
jgi:hypothetical protein